MSDFRVFVSVGSDHHPFQRLVDWADRWAQAHPDTVVTVQFGTARSPRHAVGHAYLTHDELLEQMSAADAIVVQGGPTAISEAREHGRIPIVVPRHRSLGEHVDDHQRAFARFLGDAGRVVWCDADEAALATALDGIRERPGDHRVAPGQDAAEVAATVERFATLVADLTTRRGLLRRRSPDQPHNLRSEVRR